MAKKGIRQENYGKILEAGKFLFVKQGIGNTTLQEIANSAGVAKKTVLNIFTSKNNLAFLCAISIWDAFYSQLEVLCASPAYQEKTGLEQLIDIQVYRAKRYEENPYYADIIMEIESITCKNEEERFNRACYTEKERQLFSYFEKALQKGEQDGSIKFKMDRTAAFTFLFVWFGAIIQRFGHIQQNSELAQSLDIYTIMHNTLRQMRYFLQATNPDVQQEDNHEG